MKRDFSDSAKEELLSLVAKVEDEKWCDFTDWVGDRWHDFEGWIGELDVKDYINNVNTYHKKVIDKNNTTKSDINKIFENVNTVSEQYRSRLAALLSDLQGFKNTLNTISSVITPGNGNFNSEYIGKGLKGVINQYIESSKYLETIAGDGLTEEEALNMDESTLQSLLDMYASAIIDNTPDIKIGDKLEIPIGPGTKMYYTVSAKLKGNGDADLNYVVKDQKLELKDYDYTYDFGGGVSGTIDNDGKVSVEVSQKNLPNINVSMSGVSATYENTIGANTYSYKYENNFNKQEFTMEESVATDLDAGIVTSTIGIKSSNQTKWKPLPEPVLVESPYTCQIPEFDVDWVTVVVVIGGTLYVAKKVAGVVLVPATGGVSLILTVT